MKTYSQEGGKVHESFLKAVVYIKVNNSSGTGFIVGVGKGKGKDRMFFLVTNKQDRKSVV